MPGNEGAVGGPGQNSALPLAALTVEGGGWMVEGRKDPRRLQQDLDSASLIKEETSLQIQVSYEGAHDLGVACLDGPELA
jgi:hypothetical protein